MEKWRSEEHQERFIVDWAENCEDDLLNFLEVVEADFLKWVFLLDGTTEEAGAGLLRWGFDTETVTDLGSLGISSITEGTTPPKRVGPDKGAERSYPW